MNTKTSAHRINNAELLAKFFRGLSDSSRHLILSRLRSGPASVSELVEETGLSQPNVSNHLCCLKDCGLVSSQADGRRVIYALADKRIESLLRVAEQLLADTAKGVFECTHIISKSKIGAHISGKRHG